MEYLVEILFSIILLALWWYKNDCSKYANRAPGPLRIPVFGSLLHVLWTSRDPAIAYKKLADKYGDVMFLKLGGGEMVVCCGPDPVREILTHDKAIGRTQFEVIKDRHNNRNMGVIWSYGPTWQTLRKFTVRSLRDYGFGKSAEVDSVVNEELDKFLAHLKNEIARAPENILHVEDLFNLALVNVLWRLVSGKSYDLKDEKMLRLLKLNDDFFQSTNFVLDISSVFPVLRKWFPNWSGKTIQTEAAQAFFDYGKELLEEYRTNTTLQTEPQNFIEAFIAKVEQSKNDPDTYFTDDQFVMTILDLLIAGSETSSKTLTFGILYMLLYPKVQEKIQREIDLQIPHGTPVEPSIKSKLPYTTAALLETLRFSTILPSPTSREATEDFYFREHFVKKGTCIIASVYTVHFSKSIWGDPYVFRPERFLTSDETGINKQLADLVIPFGGGKRVCLGQSLAETTLFVYFASMLRNFKFIKVPGTNPSAKPVPGITYSPQPFDVKIVMRDSAESK